MEEKKNILTYEGLRQYEEELHELKVVRRKEIAQKIKEAREQGDLSENAEYDAAKDEQRDVEARIEELEKILKNVEVVAEEDVTSDHINIGCTVKIRFPTNPPSAKHLSELPSETWSLSRLRMANTNTKSWKSAKPARAEHDRKPFTAVS